MLRTFSLAFAGLALVVAFVALMPLLPRHILPRWHSMRPRVIRAARYAALLPLFALPALLGGCSVLADLPLIAGDAAVVATDAASTAKAAEATGQAVEATVTDAKAAIGGSGGSH